MTTGRDFARGVNPNHPAAFNKAASGGGGFNPDEARDDHGRWTSGGGGTTSGHSNTVGRHGYNADAVNSAIASSNRAGRKIGGKEAKLIHRLMRGRG